VTPRPAGGLRWLAIRRPIPRGVHVGLAVAGVLVLLLAYFALSASKKAENPKDQTVPSIGQLIDGVKEVVTPDRRGNIIVLDDSLATFYRFAVGFALGSALGVGLGLAMGCYTFIEAIALPPVAFLARIPPPAIFTIIFVLAGTGMGYFAVSIAVGITPILAQTVFAAVREDVPGELIDKARTMGASQAEMIFDVIVPTVLPRVLDAVRLQIGPALVFLIAAEYVNASVGIGYQTRFQVRSVSVNVMIIYALLLGLFGFVLDFALRQLRRFVSPWYAR
jgi:NitT/TauT family transport system permease protein